MQTQDIQQASGVGGTLTQHGPFQTDIFITRVGVSGAVAAATVPSTDVLLCTLPPGHKATLFDPATDLQFVVGRATLSQLWGSLVFAAVFDFQVPVYVPRTWTPFVVQQGNNNWTRVTSMLWYDTP